MKKLLFLLILALGLVPSTLAYDLSDFPEPFNISAHIIAGDNKEDVIASSSLVMGLDDDKITKINNCDYGEWGISIHCAQYEEFELLLDTNFSLDKFDKYNIISIGGPCANKVTAQIMDLPTTWPECANGFEEGVGRIKLYNKWNKTQLIVAGYNAKDTLKAGKLFADYIKYNLSGKEVEVTGNISNPTIRRLISEQDKRYCEKDEGCKLFVSVGCGCDPCMNLEYSSPEVIAVNKNFKEECEPMPKGVICPGCSTVIVASGDEDLIVPICRNNRCEKKTIYKVNITPIPIPKSSSPYTADDLRLITKVDEDRVDEDNWMVDEIFNILQQKAITFNGEKYNNFDTEINLEKRSDTSNYRVFIFYGKGCILNGSCDNYYIRIDFQNDVMTDWRESVAWRGIPNKYKQLAIDIVKRDEPEIIEKTTSNPNIRWIPGQHGNLRLSFYSPSGFENTPRALVVVNLEELRIVEDVRDFW